MTEMQIRFDDGAAYEKMMGTWSRLAGQVFLDWLKPPPGLRWLDVGCGNGAFTELLLERCAPTLIDGIDPSEAQLAFACRRAAGKPVRFHQGDAMALPYPSGDFDAAVMALVIFFVPDPAKGVAEMVRAVKPGGSVSAYAWDVARRGLPAEPVAMELREMGLRPPPPPSADASRIDSLQKLWKDAGLLGVETARLLSPGPLRTSPNSGRRPRWVPPSLLYCRRCRLETSRRSERGLLRASCPTRQVASVTAHAPTR